MSLQTLDTNISMDTDEILSLIDSKISTAISTLSLLTAEDVSTAISTAVLIALVPLQDEISEVAEFSRNLQGEIAKVKKSLSVGVASPMENRVESSKTIEAKPARKSPEALDLNTATTASWGAFHQILGLDCLSSQKSVELGAIASARAAEMGFVGWTFDGKKQRFNRT
jgi:FtsZ-binding cell division protein ZapB